MTVPTQDVIALIPAYQEAPRIQAVVSAAGRHLPVLVVDDGSTDGTSAVADSAGAAVLRQVPNAGKGAALRAGFARAIETGARAVVTLDGDGQHDPDEIPSLLSAYERSGAALVIGRRDFSAMPLARRAANTIGRMIVSVAIGRDIPDNQSGYRLIAAPLMKELLASTESGFGFEVEMIARCLALGLPMEWVPVRTIYAGEPSHIRPLAHFLEFLRVARVARRIVRAADA